MYEIKNIFLLISIFFCVFAVSLKARACDPLGCLLAGNKQDALVIAQITSKTKDGFNARTMFVFPQTKLEELKENKYIQIANLNQSVNLTDEESRMIAIGKKYLMSLNKNYNFYEPAWGIYEVAGASYPDMQLVKNRTTNDAALQIFINSGGEIRDFNFVGDQVVIKNNEDNLEKAHYRKEKDIILYSVIAGIVIILSSVLFVLKRKKV